MYAVNHTLMTPTSLELKARNSLDARPSGSYHQNVGQKNRPVSSTLSSENRSDANELAYHLTVRSLNLKIHNHFQVVSESCHRSVSDPTTTWYQYNHWRATQLEHTLQ